MKLSEFCIKRPVFATVINLLIILVGVVCYSKLTVREYPKVDEPVVSVSTHYFGASSEIIESQVTKPLEDALSGLEGVDLMTSESVDERSQITIVFKDNREIESATNDVRDRVGQARAMLPSDAKEPIITKADADGDAMMWLSVTSDTMSLMQMSEYVDLVLKDKIEMVPGVAQLFIVGNRTPTMRVAIDSLKLSSYGLSTQDIAQAITHQNVELPGGRIESSQVEFSVYAKTSLMTQQEFENIIIKQNEDFTVHLKDVATVEIAPSHERFLSRYNTEPTVAIGIIKQSTANPLDISNELLKLLPQIEETMPEGMKLNLAYDSTTVIKKSIHSVYKTLFEAVILVVLVIFLFLRQPSATLIPIVTIPISLIGAFAILAAFGYTINTLTLLAMVLAIGLVVDDAIVVLENIYRHVESGMKAVDAAILGMKEIGTAVVAMTLTLLAVFTPVAFSSGHVGKLFIEFAVVLGGSVLISGIVALTLSPMMCSCLLKHETNHGKWYWIIEAGLDKVNAWYKQGLEWSLKSSKWILIGFVALLLLNGLMFAALKSELTPPEDRGFIINIGMAPEGATLAYTDKYAKQVEQILSADENVRGFFTVIGWPNVTQTLSFGLMPPFNERDISQFEAVDNVNKHLWGIPGIMSFAVNPPSSLGGGSLKGEVGFVIQSPKGFEVLESINTQLLEKVRENPQLLNVQTDLILNKPQVRLTVDRERAASLGVEIDAIGHTISTLFGGQNVTKFKQGAKQYDVVLKSEQALKKTPKAIEQIYVPTKFSTQVPLASLVHIEETVVPKSLNHFNKLPAMTLTAALAPGYTIDEALTYLEATLSEISSDALYDYAGASRTYKQSAKTIGETFLLALIVIFLVLAAQFESFKNPLIILLSVPCAILGAFLLLHLTGGTLNIFSQIGLITLIGLISKHGILIVEFANQLRSQGMDAAIAIKEAALLRFRPILMTTCATILGAMPLAIATGAGSEGRTQIGLTIVGGMLIGTCFTVFVVPVIYQVANDNLLIGKVRTQIGSISTKHINKIRSHFKKATG